MIIWCAPSVNGLLFKVPRLGGCYSDGDDASPLKASASPVCAGQWLVILGTDYSVGGNLRMSHVRTQINS